MVSLMRRLGKSARRVFVSHVTVTWMFKAGELDGMLMDVERACPKKKPLDWIVQSACDALRPCYLSVGFSQTRLRPSLTEFFLPLKSASLDDHDTFKDHGLNALTS